MVERAVGPHRDVVLPSGPGNASATAQARFWLVARPRRLGSRRSRAEVGPDVADGALGVTALSRRFPAARNAELQAGADRPADAIRVLTGIAHILRGRGRATREREVLLSWMWWIAPMIWAEPQPWSTRMLATPSGNFLALVVVEEALALATAGRASGSSDSDREREPVAASERPGEQVRLGRAVVDADPGAEGVATPRSRRTTRTYRPCMVPQSLLIWMNAAASVTPSRRSDRER